VTGCPGAIYRKFDSEEEAQQFLTSSTLRDQPKDGSPVLYTDGSFADGRGGYGVVQEGYQLRAWGRVPHFPNLDNNVAELYAIYRALTLTTGDIWIVTDSRYSISTLTSYRHGATTAYPQVISLIEPLLEGRTIGWRHVPGHSGHHYNEVADQLAAMGATGTEELVQG
jgi:ribonuclease HI